MRTKLISVLIAACAIGMMGFGPASALASEVSLNIKGELEESYPLKEGSYVIGKDTETIFYLHHALYDPASCDGEISSELLENGPEQVLMEPPSMAFSGCSIWTPWGTYSLTVSNVETSQLKIGADGTGELEFAVTLHSKFYPSGGCKYQSSPMTFTPVADQYEGVDVSFFAQLNLVSSGPPGCSYNIDMESNFPLTLEGETPIGVVFTE